MTKEEIQYEAQSIIQEWGSNDSAPYVEFVEKLASMELPESFSNLDEAALKELQVYLPQGNGPDGICYFIAAQMLAMYKAGAEWMAGQGVTEVSRLYRDPNPPHEGLFFGVLPFFSTIQMALNYQDGEEVIVQIRKKQ